MIPDKNAKGSQQKQTPSHVCQTEPRNGRILELINEDVDLRPSGCAVVEFRLLNLPFLQLFPALSTAHNMTVFSPCSLSDTLCSKILLSEKLSIGTLPAENTVVVEQYYHEMLLS